MKTTVVLILAAAAVLGGCGAATYSDPSASPESWNMGTWSQQRQCSLGSGYWNRTAGVCEYDEIR